MSRAFKSRAPLHVSIGSKSQGQGIADVRFSPIVRNDPSDSGIEYDSEISVNLDRKVSIRE